MTFSFASQEEADRVHDLIDAECRKLGLKSLRSRAELLDIPEIAMLGTDSCGLPLALSNHYCCPHCNTTWTDEWSCEVAGCLQPVRIQQQPGEQHPPHPRKLCAALRSAA